MEQPVTRRVRAHGDGGFTLVELLVAVVIEALIVGALAAAFTGILRGTSQVNQSLSKSSDARIAAAYVVGDASNSSGPEISLTDTTSCTDSNPPVAGTPVPVVRFDSTITSSTGATQPDIVIYMLVSSNGVAPFSFVRRECRNGALVSDDILATSVAAVSVTCSPSATPQCSGTPTSITVTITETADPGGGQYTYSLTGTFQKLIGDGQPFSGGVVLLGAGPTCSGSTNTIDISGSGTMRVYGEADINTADGASCNAMSLSGSGVFKSGVTSILQGGSCVNSGGTVCPPTTPYSPAVTDPYANLPVPTNGSTQPGCAGAQSSQTATAGFYPSGFTLGGGDTCTLASGVYVVQGGFDVGNGATLLTGSGGVLIYLLSGQFSINGGASVTLTAMSTPTYKGVVLWQAAADTNAISLSNGGAILFNGAIYGKKAQLNITGNAQTPFATAIVVQTVVITNSGGITVGAPSVPGLSISTTSLPAAPVNSTYPSTTLTPAGGDGNYTWAASNLPAGLSLNSTTGVISGTTPATPVSKSVTVTLSDQLGDNVATKVLAISIDALPTVSSTSPSSRGVGAASQTVTITGTGFVSGATVAFSGSALTVGSPTVASGTKITVSVAVPAGATVGARNVTVTNPDGGVGTGTAVFSVTTAPTVSSTSPSSRGVGAASQTVTITGTGFVSGATVAFSGSALTVGSPTVTNGTTMTVSVAVPAGATVGARDVTVTNPDGGVGSGAGVFTVNAAPVVSSLSPSSMGKGAASQTVTITGTGFVSGATIAFSGSALTVGSPTVTNGTTITVSVAVPAGATVGARNVTVTNPDGGVGVGTGVFTVTAAPTLSSVSPNQGAHGTASLSIVVTGTGFLSGSSLTASFTGAGISVTSIAVTTGTTQVTIVIAITSGAATGNRTLTLTNGDGGVSASGVTFKVT